MTPPLRSNLFELDNIPEDSEFLETLAKGDGVRVERIVSRGHITPPGEWYDQDVDEWVVLLQGRATLEWEGGEETELEAGDWLLIAAHRRHRVSATSVEPACVWLAVHGALATPG